MLSTILNDTVRDANRLFNSAFGPMGQPIASGGPVGRMPGVNLWRTSDHCVAEMELPGYRMEDLEVLVTEDTLTVCGQRQPTHPEEATVLRAERSPIRFERSIPMPVAVDADHAEATLESGVLRVTLPIAASARPQRIAIRSGDAESSQSLPDAGEATAQA